MPAQVEHAGRHARRPHDELDGHGRLGGRDARGGPRADGLLQGGRRLRLVGPGPRGRGLPRRRRAWRRWAPPRCGSSCRRARRTPCARRPATSAAPSSPWWPPRTGGRSRSGSTSDARAGRGAAADRLVGHPLDLGHQGHDVEVVVHLGDRVAAGLHPERRVHADRPPGGRDVPARASAAGRRGSRSRSPPGRRRRRPRASGARSRCTSGRAVRQPWQRAR